MQLYHCIYTAYTTFPCTRFLCLSQAPIIFISLKIGGYHLWFLSFWYDATIPWGLTCTEYLLWVVINMRIQPGTEMVHWFVLRTCPISRLFYWFEILNIAQHKPLTILNIDFNIYININHLLFKMRVIWIWLGDMMTGKPKYTCKYIVHSMKHANLPGLVVFWYLLTVDVINTLRIKFSDMVSHLSMQHTWRMSVYR